MKLKNYFEGLYKKIKKEDDKKEEKVIQYDINIIKAVNNFSKGVKHGKKNQPEKAERDV